MGESVLQRKNLRELAIDHIPRSPASKPSSHYNANTQASDPSDWQRIAFGFAALFAMNSP